MKLEEGDEVIDSDFGEIHTIISIHFSKGKTYYCCQNKSGPGCYQRVETWSEKELRKVKRRI